MSTIGNTNFTFNFMPQVVSKLDDQAADSLYNVTSIKKQDTQQQENSRENYGSGTDALQESIHNLNQKMVGLGKTSSSSQEESPLDQFLTESNQLHSQLQNISNTRLAQSSLVDDIQNWRLGVIHELAHTEHAKNTEASATRQATLINQVVSLVHSVNEHTETPLPIGETLSTRSALLSSKEDNSSSNSQPHSSLTNEENPSLGDTQKTHDPANTNLYTIMLALVISANTIVNNAISMQTRMNDLLQEMMKDLQDFLGLATLVNKAYKDAQAQAVTDHSDDTNELNFGWISKSQNGKGLDMAALLKERNALPNNAKDQWLVNAASGTDLSQIQLGLYNASKGGQPNDLLKIYGHKDGSGNYFMDLNDMNGMLQKIGANMAPFVGGNIASQNVDAFDSATTLDGVTKSVTSSIDNLQSQSGANISKLNLANQGLNSAVSNFVTLMSNLLSVMMKLAAV